MLTITTRSKADAECIGRELTAFASAIETASEGWRVTIDDESFNVVRILSVLETCLGANRIDCVSVSYGGRKYVMEAASR